MRKVMTDIWPATGDYHLFDELLYYGMASDETRNASYKRAIQKEIGGKTVVDVGTGAEAILSRFCVEGGARRVYAIEMSADAASQASRTLESLGLTDRIELIHGNSRDITLPEKVDYCISELVGTIGSAEGIIPILRDARRFLKSEKCFIPCRVVTKIAAVSLPEPLRERPVMSEIPSHYTQQIFSQRGFPFDLRLCITNLPHEHIISTTDTFEDIDCLDLDAFSPSRELTLTILDAGVLQGFLVWVCIETSPSDVIDTLAYSGCWSPAFFPVFYPGIAVSKGDVVRATSRTISLHEDMRPDYRIEGEVQQQDNVRSFSYASVLSEDRFRHNPFYDRLFDPAAVPSMKWR